MEPLAPLTPGSTSSISSSQCTLAGTGSSVSMSADNLTVKFALTFSSNFTGSKNAYLSSNTESFEHRKRQQRLGA
jgi:hypothetical protein